MRHVAGWNIQYLPKLGDIHLLYKSQQEQMNKSTNHMEFLVCLLRHSCLKWMHTLVFVFFFLPQQWSMEKRKTQWKHENNSTSLCVHMIVFVLLKSIRLLFSVACIEIHYENKHRLLVAKHTNWKRTFSFLKRLNVEPFWKEMAKTKHFNLKPV